MQYLKAPISEVVFGLNFDFQKITPKQILEIDTLFAAEFSDEEVLPVTLIPNLKAPDQSFFSDPTSYGYLMLRKKTVKKDWMIQIQSNRFYLNWLKDDLSTITNYEGFDQCFKKFSNIITLINEKLNINLKENIKYLELSYMDRFLITELSTDLDKVISFSLPSVLPKNADFLNQYKYDEKAINGVCFINFMTEHSADKKYINLNVNLVGEIKKLGFEQWFEAAHKKQIELFQEIFTDEAKKVWE